MMIKKKKGKGRPELPESELKTKLPLSVKARNVAPIMEKFAEPIKRYEIKLDKEVKQ